MPFYKKSDIIIYGDIMKKNNKKIIIGIILTLIVGCLTYILINYNNNLIKLNYNELVEKVENKEDFVLCISATECIHCKEYKPKLKKISNKYNIKIYYMNKDELTDTEYENLKKNFSFDGGTPTTIFFKNGEEKTTATRIEGNVKIEKIIDKLKNNGFITE